MEAVLDGNQVEDQAVDEVVDEVGDQAGVEAVLDTVESLYLQTIASNATIFVLAVQFVDLNNGHSLAGPDGRVLPGLQRRVRLGGSGTPLIAEFAPVEFGARMQMGTYAAKSFIADALDTCYRLPRLWARIQAGEIKVAYARHVAAATRHLDQEDAAMVDAAVATYADGRRTWSQFTELVAAKVIEADPEDAAAREEEAGSRQFARPGRSSGHGVRGFYLRAGAGLIARFDATVAYLAAALRALGDPSSEDARRVKACAILANPTQAVELLVAFANHRSQSPDNLTQDTGEHAGENEDEGADADTGQGAGEDESDQPLPNTNNESGSSDTDTDSGSGNPAADAAVLIPRRFRPGGLTAADLGMFRCDLSKLLPPLHLYVHVSQDSFIRDANGVARWEGEGPITLQHISERLSPWHKVIMKPVIDLENQTPVDAYEIPNRHREAVRLLAPGDIFPFSTLTSATPPGEATTDIDHTTPYDPGGPPGQSRIGNYGLLQRFHHRIKTHGPWELRQPFPGIYLWRDPHGHYYLHDHTGTRKITGPGPRPRAPDHHTSTATQTSHATQGIQMWEPHAILEADFTHAC